MSKITMTKYVNVAEKMRNSNNYLLDISNYSAEETAMITVLVQNDAIFNFFNSVKHIDVRKIKAVVEFLDAKENLQASSVKFSD